MKMHKNARLTFARRLELVKSVVQQGVAVCAAAASHGVSLPTARKWVRRYSAHGDAGLHDRASRPQRMPKATTLQITEKILDLRRSGLTMRAIVAEAGCSLSTVSRICACAGLSRQSVTPSARDVSTTPVSIVLAAA